jgi:hypothetical protein
MTTSVFPAQPPVRNGPIRSDPAHGAPISRLRGARVEVDGARVASVFLGVALIAIAVCAVAFFVIGAHKNAQINELRDHGVPVEVTVTSCLGLLGGSGSNTAGYSCMGTFEVSGHRFNEAIPGLERRGPGDKVAAVAAANASGLFSTTAMIAGERASWKVFILPVVLTLVLLLSIAGLLLQRRKKSAAAANP